MSWIVPTLLAFALAFLAIWSLCEWLIGRLGRRSAARRNEARFDPRIGREP